MQFNQQLLDALMKKYGQAKAIMPAIPGAGATNALAGTVLDKVREAIPAPEPSTGYNPESGMGPAPVQPPLPPTPPAMPPVAPKPALPAALPASPISAPPAVNTPPISAMPQPAVPQMDGQYNDAARQQLYAQLAAKRKEGGAYAAVAGLGDMARRMGGSTGVDAQENIQKQINSQDTTAREQFDSGKKGQLEDISTGLALKKAGREETEYTDQNDPNSQMSKLAVGFLQRMGGAEKMGVVPGKTSYADSVKIMPMVEKYVAMEQMKADKAKQASATLYQKKAQQTESTRGDKALATTELQRDAAKSAYRTLATTQALTGSLSQNPVDYIDTLGQLYKARTGQAPTDNTFNHIKQEWLGGKAGAAWTFFTGQQAPVSSNNIGQSLLDMVDRMGDQADLDHEGYMRSRVDTRGLAADDAAALTNIGQRGYSYAEEKRMLTNSLKNGRTTLSAAASRPGSSNTLSKGWTVKR